MSEAFRPAAGFSLVELMIGITIVTLVGALGVPSFVSQVRDGRIRTIADELHDGLQMARQEAIQRNTTIRFDVLSSGWQVVLPGTTDGVLAGRTNTTKESSYTVTATASTLSFNGSGRASTSSFRVDVASASATCKASGGAIRCLRIVVQPGGAIKSCDPAAASNDPRKCP